MKWPAWSQPGGISRLHLALLVLLLLLNGALTEAQGGSSGSGQDGGGDPLQGIIGIITGIIQKAKDWWKKINGGCPPPQPFPPPPAFAPAPGPAFGVMGLEDLEEAKVSDPGEYPGESGRADARKVLGMGGSGTSGKKWSPMDSLWMRWARNEDEDRAFVPVHRFRG